MPKTPPWEHWAIIFGEQIALRQEEWNCEIPEIGSLPSKTLDLEVSVWCQKIANNFLEPVPVPPNIQPWVIARLIAAVLQCEEENRLGHPSHPFTPATISNFLVEGWEQVMIINWKSLEPHNLPPGLAS